MRKNIKVLGAIAVAGVVATTGSAFTGTGVGRTNIPTSTFIGGSVGQEVSGAVLTSLKYGFTDGGNTTINRVLLTFDAGANGKVVGVSFTGGTTTAFTCPNVAVNGKGTVETADDVYESNCTGGTATGISAISVNVTGDSVVL